MAAPSLEKGIPMLCMACTDPTCDFKPVRLSRRSLGPRDVCIEMKFCGICHTDVHFAANHTKGFLPSEYPCVPGHELAGVCTAVGAEVIRFQVGDQVGVGCMVDSCLNCRACKRGEEQMCMRQTATYQGKNTNGRAAVGPGAPHDKTLGGYSTVHVVDERFAVLIPPEYPLEYAGPVLCAGVTMYDPLKKHATAGMRVGIVGLGGLGVIGIKLAKALGCEVTAISRGGGMPEQSLPPSPDLQSSGPTASSMPQGSPPRPMPAKAALATRAGARTFVASTDPEAMAAAEGSLDLILNTIPCAHSYMAYQKLLTPRGKQVLLGLHEGLIAGMVVGMATFNRSRILGSGIGSIRATQEVIDLCAKEQIYPEIEVVGVERLNDVYEQLMATNEAGKRYVLNIRDTLNEAAFATCERVRPPDLGPPQPGPTPTSIVLEIAKMVLFGRWW